MKACWMQWDKIYHLFGFLVLCWFYCSSKKQKNFDVICMKENLFYIKVNCGFYNLNLGFLYPWRWTLYSTRFFYSSAEKMFCEFLYLQNVFTKLQGKDEFLTHSFTITWSDVIVCLFSCKVSSSFIYILKKGTMRSLWSISWKKNPTRAIS